MCKLLVDNITKFSAGCTSCKFVLRDSYSRTRIQERILNRLFARKTQAVSDSIENPRAFVDTDESVGVTANMPRGKTHLGELDWVMTSRSTARSPSGRAAFQKSHDTCASRPDSQRTRLRTTDLQARKSSLLKSVTSDSTHSFRMYHTWRADPLSTQTTCRQKTNKETGGNDSPLTKCHNGNQKEKEHKREKKRHQGVS